MLLAIVSNNGNPGEGNKKLSPFWASNNADAHIAILPPEVKNTWSLVNLYFLAENLSTSACRASSSPWKLVYPSTFPTLLAII